MTTDSKPDLRIYKTPEELADGCASYIRGELERSISSKGRATLAISGGSTPKPMFQKLAKSGLDWWKVHIFWVDERCVPPDSELSNFRFAKENLLDLADIPNANTHRIDGELEPIDASRKYVQAIREFFRLSDGQLPVFDVLHRGIGPDAHTASLFPGEPLINDHSNIAANVWVEKLKMARVTLLPGVLERASRTVLQVANADKAEPVFQVLFGPEDPMRYPCQIAARGSDKAVWFLDEAAAAKVKDR
ncbi:MAG: 6-phosphogluconolactonase [Acidobacteriaceae bacterium]|nr:6-phosphogluconolactonase [Acidobacteriaceae bacterium]